MIPPLSVWAVAGPAMSLPVVALGATSIVELEDLPAGVAAILLLVVAVLLILWA